jgi:hypothetical protein
VETRGLSNVSQAPRAVLRMLPRLSSEGPAAARGRYRVPRDQSRIETRSSWPDALPGP